MRHEKVHRSQSLIPYNQFLAPHMKRLLILCVSFFEIQMHTKFKLYEKLRISTVNGTSFDLVCNVRIFGEWIVGEMSE